MERLDLCIRFDYHRKDLEKEYRKLVNRIQKTNLHYSTKELERLGRIILDGSDQERDYQEALRCLGGLFA